MKSVVGNLAVSRVKCMNAQYKWKLVTSTSVDYVGQKATTKLDETVRFFTNPLKTTTEDDNHQELIKLNLEFEDVNEKLMEKKITFVKTAAITKKSAIQCKEAKMLGKAFSDKKK